MVDPTLLSCSARVNLDIIVHCYLIEGIGSSYVYLDDLSHISNQQSLTSGTQIFV